VCFLTTSSHICSVLAVDFFYRINVILFFSPHQQAEHVKQAAAALIVENLMEILHVDFVVILLEALQL